MLGHVEIAPERPTSVRETPLIGILRDTLAYAREREYTGWEYGDGMSSRLRRALPGDNRWVNLAIQGAVRRSPVNLRRAFLVEQRRSYEGAALFAVANLTFDELVSEISYADEDRSIGIDYRDEARTLADWLLDNQCEGYSGFCGGRRHAVQHRDRKRESSDPDVVATARGVRALLTAEPLAQRYADAARTAAGFVVDDLDYRAVEGGAKIRSHRHSGDGYAPHEGALAARLFVDLYEAFGDRAFRERATALLDYLADLQTEAGGWPTRDPPSGTPRPVTSHTGTVIEAFLRYQEVVDDRYEETLADALEFYRETLFEEDGAPNWDAGSTYPRDVRAAAQGVVVFTHAGDLGFADKVIDWALDALHAGDGRFYHRQGRLYTRRTTLMCRCQAWTAYALSEYLSAKHDRSRPDFPVT